MTALVAVQAPAAAQQSDFGLEVRLEPRILYDTNIVRSSEEVARARGLVREDVRFTPGATIAYSRPIGRLRLFGEALLSYDIHLRNERLDRERILGRAGAEIRHGRCVSTAEVNYARRQTELEDIILGPVDNTESTVAAIASIDCPREAGLYPTFAAGYRKTENDQPFRRRADFNVLTLEGRLTRASLSDGRASVGLRYRQIEYPERSAIPGELERIDVVDAAFRYVREIGSLVRSNASVEYTHVDVDGGAGFDGVTYSGELRFFPHGKLRPRVALQRRVEPSNRIGVLFQEEKIATVEAEYRFSPFSRATFGVTRRERAFRTSTVAPVEQVTREEFRVVYGALETEITRAMTLTLSTQWEKRETNVPLFDYTSKRVGLSTRVVFR